MKNKHTQEERDFIAAFAQPTPNVGRNLKAAVILTSADHNNALRKRKYEDSVQGN